MASLFRCCFSDSREAGHLSGAEAGIPQLKQATGAGPAATAAAAATPAATTLVGSHHGGGQVAPRLSTEVHPNGNRTSLFSHETTDYINELQQRLCGSAVGDFAKRLSDLPTVLLATSDVEEARLLAVSEGLEGEGFVVVCGASRAGGFSSLKPPCWPAGMVFTLRSSTGTDSNDGESLYSSGPSLQRLHVARAPVVTVLPDVAAGGNAVSAHLAVLQAAHPPDFLELHLEYGFTHMAVVPLVQGQQVVGAVALFGRSHSSASTYSVALEDSRYSPADARLQGAKGVEASEKKRARQASYVGPLPASTTCFIMDGHKTPAGPGFPTVKASKALVSFDEMSRLPSSLRMLGSCLSLACLSLESHMLSQMAAAVQGLAQAPSLPLLAANLASSLEQYCVQRLHTNLRCHVALVPGVKAQVGMFLGMSAEAMEGNVAASKQAFHSTGGQRTSMGRRPNTGQSAGRMNIGLSLSSAVGKQALTVADSLIGNNINASMSQQLHELRPQKSEQLSKMSPRARSHSNYGGGAPASGGGGGTATGTGYVQATSLLRVEQQSDYMRVSSFSTGMPILQDTQLPWKAVGFKVSRSLMNTVLKDATLDDGALPIGSVKGKCLYSCRAHVQETQGACTDLNVLARHSDQNDLAGSMLVVCVTLGGPGANRTKQDDEAWLSPVGVSAGNATLGLFLTSDEPLPEMLLDRAREKCCSLLARVLLPVLRHRLMGDLAIDVALLRDAAAKPVDGERGGVQSINLSCNPDAFALGSSHNSFSNLTPRQHPAATAPSFQSRDTVRSSSGDGSPANSTKLPSLNIHAKREGFGTVSAGYTGSPVPHHGIASRLSGEPGSALSSPVPHHHHTHMNPAQHHLAHTTGPCSNAGSSHNTTVTTTMAGAYSSASNPNTAGPTQAGSRLSAFERNSHLSTRDAGMRDGGSGLLSPLQHHLAQMGMDGAGASPTPSANIVKLDLVMEPADVSMQAQVDALRKAVHSALVGLLLHDSRETGPGRYQPQDLQHLMLGDVLGRGGNGVVLRGSLYGMDVAVKVFDFPEDVDQQATLTSQDVDTTAEHERKKGKEDSVAGHHRRALARLATELAVCGSISHPSIVQVYAHFTGVSLVKDPNNTDIFTLQPAAPADEWDTVYISSHSAPCVAVVMDMCDLGGLDTAIEQKRFMQRGTSQVNMPAILRTLLEVAMALRHLHSLNLVHCDLKPGNVLLKSSSSDPRGFTAKLSDFGYTTLMRERDINGRPCLIMEEAAGTLPYMAPEIFIKGMTTNEKIDIYALGIVAWQLYTGQRLYPGVKPNEVGYLVVQKDLRPPFHPSTPHGYRALAEACWHKDARRRPSAASVIRALSLLLTQYRGRSGSSSLTPMGSSSSTRQAAPPTPPQAQLQPSSPLPPLPPLPPNAAAAHAAPAKATQPQAQPQQQQRQQAELPPEPPVQEIQQA